ncbi:hypothetical protein DC083_05115 [Ignatzschineria ureiclastica]|uniref:Outer membrane protein beta-barrel domain-containing protein n=1 Tax=Ignatzschineria ureiclastica TaxID=472582 RepID=A0A2U2AF42_9GAMM|nr:outer membrane protein [Ignatzschineria ureiclastica]PWD81270.1 hypothetical protein DC083_05115 [Ignatzschineria ureiclastica]GGZ97657.1 hypothetical protein GCM10007162_12300 [Ignatzschineria ureiclastica]
MKIRALLATTLLLGAVSSAETGITKGFYVNADMISAKQKAKDLDDSLQPNSGAFNIHKDSKSFLTGSLGLGYQFNDLFRIGVEYVLPKKVEYSSSRGKDFNYHNVKGQRVMLNGYLSYPVNETIDVYATAGIGYARLKSSGYQNSEAYTFNTSTKGNFAWSLGAGISFKPIENTYIDLGVRYVDMGKADTGMSRFGKQNQKLKSKISSTEFTLGVRYMLGELYTEDEFDHQENIYADHVTPELKESFERANQGREGLVSFKEYRQIIEDHAEK